jgi:hypothetical protein
MAIDWDATEKKFGYNQLPTIKRPKVVCTCDSCAKLRVIAVRVRSRVIDGQLSWLCPSCVKLRDSANISHNMIRQWRDERYRNNQLAIKSNTTYKEIQAVASNERWASKDYRDKLATGIDTVSYIKRSRELYGDRFNYLHTKFGNWQDRIKVVCTRCDYTIDSKPSRHLKYGYCPKCGMSTGHRELEECLMSFGHTPLINDWSVLGDLELDLYLPEKRFAIEYHGIYRHSFDTPETSRQKKRHQEKAIRCLENKILLYQIFDYEWKQQRQLIESMIGYILGDSEKLNARDLVAGEINNASAKPFFERNHLQGHRPAGITFALLGGNEIFMVMSFSKHKNGYEIIRMATKCGTQIRGGASKLLTHFLRKYPVDLYTFADLRYSTGRVYYKLGFNKLRISNPGYFYTRQLSGDSNYLILSRQRCQKHNLSNLLGDQFDPGLSEPLNMFNNGFRRVWTAGNILLKKTHHNTPK